MKLMCEESVKIEDGAHDGVIVGISFRDIPYKYTDLVIEFEEGKRLKYGVPTKLTPESQLGKLMDLFGTTVSIGKEYDLDQTFIGKKCIFMTMKQGKYSNIVKDSLKLLKEG